MVWATRGNTRGQYSKNTKLEIAGPPRHPLALCDPLAQPEPIGTQARPPSSGEPHPANGVQVVGTSTAAGGWQSGSLAGSGLAVGVVGSGKTLAAERPSGGSEPELEDVEEIRAEDLL